MGKAFGWSLIIVVIIFSLSFPVVAMAETKKIIPLPIPALKSPVSLEQTIARRRSERHFQDKELEPQQIGQLLWAAQGITLRSGTRAFRAAPSAGALYPLEVYVVMREGIYMYLPESHSLTLMQEGDKRPLLSAAAWGQKAVKEAPMSIVICAVYERVTGKYGDRGKQYVHFEVGHAAENIHLQAVALGLGSVPIGAFDDAQLMQLFNLPPEQKYLYIIPVGYIR